MREKTEGSDTIQDVRDAVAKMEHDVMDIIELVQDMANDEK